MRYKKSLGGAKNGSARRERETAGYASARAIRPSRLEREKQTGGLLAMASERNAGVQGAAAEFDKKCKSR